MPKKRTVPARTKQLIEEGYDPKQAYAIANSEERKRKRDKKKKSRKGLLVSHLFQMSKSLLDRVRFHLDRS